MYTYLYTGSLKPGWSASRSVPYSSTFWQLSRSPITLGKGIILPQSMDDDLRTGSESLGPRSIPLRVSMSCWISFLYTCTLT